MPLFFQSSRRRDPSLSAHLQDDLAIKPLRPSKSEALLADRPKTSSGVIDRKVTRPALRPLVPIHSSTGRPVETKSICVVEPSRNTFNDQSSDIGVAFGSPSDVQAPLSCASLGSVSAAAKAEQKSQENRVPDNAPQETTEATESQVRPKMKRWRTVSGLFTRKKAAKTEASPLTRISEDSEMAAEVSSKTSAEKPRHSLHLIRNRKSRLLVPPLKSHASDGDTVPQIPMPTPGNARDYEAANPDASPTLDVNIPDSGLDRYSVLFSEMMAQSNETSRPRRSLLARRNGVESLTIKSPGFARTPSDCGDTTTRPGNDGSSVDSKSAYLPTRISSLVPVAPTSRLSAVPAPLFAQKPRTLKTSQSAICLQTITSSPTTTVDQNLPPPEPLPQKPATQPPTPRLAFSSAESLVDSPTENQHATHSRHSSTLSTTSSSHFPPSPTSSTYSYYFPVSASYLRSASLSDFHASSSTDTAAESPKTDAAASPIPATHLSTSSSPPLHPPPPPPPPLRSPDRPPPPPATFLSVPTPTSHSPWSCDSSSGAPLPTPPPSPRSIGKHGYDTPHSPLVAVARTVVVSVKAGRGGAQRPQFVVRERAGRAWSAVFEGGTAAPAAAAVGA